MLERNVYEHYDLFSEERFLVGTFEAFKADDSVYLVVPTDKSAHLPAEELVRMIYYLQQKGEQAVPELIFTNYRKERAYLDGQEALLFKVPDVCLTKGDIRSAERMSALGMELALFHERGKHYPSSQGEHLLYQQWKDSWLKRLDQLEQWYARLLKSRPIESFDESFILTFPYFLGRTENAIQYLTDCELDEPNWNYDETTIAHVHFNERSWVFMNEMAEPLKLPTEMIVDVPSRDIAEYIRAAIIETHSPEEKVNTFIAQYENIRRLERRCWQKIYARLLFPLHYFETVEGYYMSRLEDKKQSYKERFFHLLERESEYENFLRRYFQDIQSVRPELVGMTVDWLR